MNGLSTIRKAIPNGITSKLGRGLLVSQKHSPTILFGAGVVGVVATAVLTARATLKFEPVLEHAHSDLESAKEARDLAAESPKIRYTDQDYKKDVATIYGIAARETIKLYSPAIGLGILSICALTGSHVILSRRNVGLTAAYALLDKSFAEYRERVKKEIGGDDAYYRHDGELRRTVDKDEKPVSVWRAGPGTPSGYARFFDQLNQNWESVSEFNLFFLRCQQNYANDKLRARGHLFLNEVYDMLGMDHSRAGAVVGWVISKEGDNFVDFGIFDGDNPRARDFVNGREGAILLDFNVDGVIYDKI